MLDTIHWDVDLIRRYDFSGLRYTSCSAAVQFHGGIGPFDQLHTLRDNRKAGHPLSLYTYIPFCANICYYYARSKVITKDRGRSAPYLVHPIREIEIISRHLSREQVVGQLRFSGGTPTFLNPGQLRELISQLRTHLDLLGDDLGDYGIEIDPHEADWSTVSLLRGLGFNHVSLGIQDFDVEVQEVVNHMQTPEETRTIVGTAHTLQYRSINLDPVCGLSEQTPGSFARTANEVIVLQPDRLSVFNYVRLPKRFMPQRRINASDLPSPGQKLEMPRRATEQLVAAGYHYISMSHFVLPDNELANAQEDNALQRNFQGYITHGYRDLAGLGISAISQIGDLYSQNSSDISDCQTSPDNDQLVIRRGLHCNNDDRVRRAVIQQLICHFELAFRGIEAEFGINFRGYFTELWPDLERFAAGGLIRLNAKGINVTSSGRLLVRSICMLFDHYLPSLSRQHFPQVI